MLHFRVRRAWVAGAVDRRNHMPPTRCPAMGRRGPAIFSDNTQRVRHPKQRKAVSKHSGSEGDGEESTCIAADMCVPLQGHVAEAHCRCPVTSSQVCGRSAAVTVQRYAMTAVTVQR